MCDTWGAYVAATLGLVVASCPAAYHFLVGTNDGFVESRVFAGGLGAAGILLAVIEMLIKRQLARAQPTAPKESEEEAAALRSPAGFQSADDAAVLAFVASEGREVPDFLSCPITKSIMRNPVVTMVGNTYECDAIVEWLTAHATDPVFNTPLPGPLLTPNVLVRRMCKDFEARVAEVDPVAAAALFPQSTNNAVPRSFTARALIQRAWKRMRAETTSVLERERMNRRAVRRNVGRGAGASNSMARADEDEEDEEIACSSSEEGEEDEDERLFAGMGEDEDGEEESAGLALFGLEPPFGDLEGDESEEDLDEDDDERLFMNGGDLDEVFPYPDWEEGEELWPFVPNTALPNEDEEEEEEEEDEEDEGEELWRFAPNTALPNEDEEEEEEEEGELEGGEERPFSVDDEDEEQTGSEDESEDATDWPSFGP